MAALRIRLGSSDDGPLRLTSRAWHKAALSLIDQALISVGNFASSIILARTLPAAEFGLFVLANFAILLAVALQNGLMIEPMVVIGAGLDDRAFGRFLRANLPLQAAFIVVDSLLVAAGVLLWEPLRPLAVPLVTATVLWQAQEFCRRVLYTRQQMGAAVVNNVISYDLQAGLLLLLTWQGQIGVKGALWVVAATSLLGLLLGALQVRPFLTSESDSVRAVARLSFRIGKWTAASTILSVISVQAFPFLLAGVAGLESAAGFGVITTILGPRNLFTRPLESYFLPRAARSLDREGTPGIRRICWQATGFAAPIMSYMLLLIAAPALVLDLFYGGRYAHHAVALRLFAVAGILFVPARILEIEIQARRMQRYLLLAEVGGIVLVYTLGVYLIAQHRLVGAGLATVVVNACQVGLFALVVLRARRDR